MSGQGYGAPIPPVMNYNPQPQYPQYPPQQQPPQYQQYPQQPQPQYPPQQQYVPHDPLADAIRVEKGRLDELKKLNRAKKRVEQNVISPPRLPQYNQQEDPSGGVLAIGDLEDPDGDDILYDQFESMELDDLERHLLRMRKGTKEYAVATEVLNDMRLAEEQLDVDELGAELEQLEFFSVRVWEESERAWITAEPRISVDDVSSLLENIKKKFPYATKVKWTKVRKDGREVAALSHKTFALQSAETARLAISKAQNTIGGEGGPRFQNQQQAGIETLAPLIDAMNRQGQASQNQMIELMKVLKEEKKPEKDPLDSMIKMKELFVSPMLESIKAMQPKGGASIDPMVMVNTMLSGAKQLAGMGGGGDGGGGSGMLGMIWEVVKPAIQPFIQQLQQNMQNMQPQNGNGHNGQNYQQQQLPPRGQQQERRQLPAPQSRGNVEDPAVALLRKKCKRIIELMLSGKLELENVPRYIFRNGQQEEGHLLMSMNHQQFTEVLKSSVNMKDPTLATFINNPKTRLGVQWIFEEFHRLYTFVGICTRNGDEELAKRVIDWKTGPLIETTLVGQQATSEFIKRYEITQEDLTGESSDEDLPDQQEADDDLPDESEDDIPVAQAKASGVPVRSGSPTSAKVDEPSATTGPTPQRARKVTPVKAVLVAEEPTREAAPVQYSHPRKKKSRPSFLKKG